MFPSSLTLPTGRTVKTVFVGLASLAGAVILVMQPMFAGPVVAW